MKTLALSSVQILNREFAKAFRGYDPAEVDAFMEELAREVDQLQEEWQRARDDHERLADELRRVRAEAQEAARRAQAAEARAAELARELQAARAELEAARRELEAARAGDDPAVQQRLRSLEHELERYREKERELADAILEARQAAAQSLKSAEERARQVLAAAEAQAAQVVEEARARAEEEALALQQEVAGLKAAKAEVEEELRLLMERRDALAEIWSSFHGKFRAAAAEFARIQEALVPEERPGVVHLDTYKKGGR
ncbi:MAG: DivIVA domain-containing protein [Firmicutes bacterium]|nr:DivIVA domain-containing protein [Bacillota bacterium]